MSRAVGAAFLRRPRAFAAASTGASSAPVGAPAAGSPAELVPALNRYGTGASGSAAGSTPIASSPAAVMKSRTPRPSSWLRQTVLSAGSALRGLSTTCSRISPRVSSAPTTLVAAPPRSEPGSGRTLPSDRWAAAERMTTCVSESLVIGWSLRCEGRDHPDPATTPSRGPEGSAAREGEGPRSVGKLGQDREVVGEAGQVRSTPFSHRTAAPDRRGPARRRRLC